MKVAMTGGGSGGHITPILAVAHEVKQIAPDSQVLYIGQKSDGLLDIVREHKAIDEVETVSAGKLRRYHGEGWRQLLDIPTQAANIRDIFRTLAGLWQSYRLLGRERPAVLFTRGGFVSVPVALAAKLRGIPYVTHDSDSVPSLANRLIARWASLHAVAMPAEVYPYPKEKVVQLGVPVGHEYAAVTDKDRRTYKQEIGVDDYEHVLLVTGGGNGAQVLNMEVVRNTKYLLATYPELMILHFAGRALVDETNAAYDVLNLGKARTRVRVFGFVSDFYRYSGAADVIVARGGATNLAEFALQQKACVLVPSKQLAWNVQNSHILAQKKAVVELTEEHAEQAERLGRTIGNLLDDADKRIAYGKRLSQIGFPDAARNLASELLKIGKSQ